MEASKVSHSEHDSCVQDVDQLIQKIPLSKHEFAHALGLSSESIAQRTRSPLVQRRLQQAMTTLNRVQPWAGSATAAWSWYRSQPIPALDGRTASEMVSSDRGDQALAYLEAVEVGGYS